MDIKLNFATIRELSCKIETGELSPISLVEDSINQIKKYDPTFNAFITILEKAALREAETTEKRIKKGHYKGPLDGIPYSLKDIIYVKGVRCTAGSRILKHFFPKRNAECLSQLRRAGSIILGTTNLNEFASGITGINPHYGSSINPWNKDHISGGSSGGSCVSVSCGMVPFSLGTDTGGSIRVPSAYCGVVGIKPTYDLISRDGIINLAPSLDNIGCITRSAWDAALVLKNLIQKDRLFHYPNISNSGEDIFEEIGHERRKLVVGIPHDYFFDDADVEIVRSFYKFVNVIESSGNQIKMVSIKGVNKIESAWTSIRLAEASEQHLRWIRSRASEYSEEVRTMIRNGLRIFAVDYIRSCGFKNEIRNNFLKSLKIADILVLPTTTVTAPKYSSFVRDNEESSKIRSALLRNNIPFNITGLPAVSIPVGFDRCKIPIGVQIVGKPYEEGTILSVAFAFEQKYNSLAKFIPPI